MTQWWERSLPTNVSRVRFPDPTSYVGWVCCWFSSLLREVFLRVLLFSRSPEKIYISKFQFDPGIHRHSWTRSCELLGAPWVNKYYISKKESLTGTKILFFRCGLKCSLPLRDTNSETSHLSPVICFRLNTLESTAKVPAEDLMRLNILRDNKTAF